MLKYCSYGRGLNCNVEGMFSESGLVGQGVVIKVKRFPVQTPRDAWLGLGTQAHYEAPGDLQVKNPKAQQLTLGE